MQFYHEFDYIYVSLCSRHIMIIANLISFQENNHIWHHLFSAQKFPINNFIRLITELIDHPLKRATHKIGLCVQLICLKYIIIFKFNYLYLYSYQQRTDACQNKMIKTFETEIIMKFLIISIIKTSGRFCLSLFDLNSINIQNNLGKITN